MVEKFEETMDMSVRPQDDFFRYANGKWLKETEIPADKTSWGSFVILRDKSLADVKSLMDKEYTGEYRHINTFYNSGMDVERRNREDFQPIKPLLDKIDAITDREQLMTVILELEDRNLLGLVGFASNMDRKNTEIEIPHFSSGGLSLPGTRFGNRDYYLNDDKESIRKEYVKYLAKLFGFIGAENPEDRAQSVLDFEILLAEKHYTQVEKRDPEMSYNKMDFATLKENYPNYNWQGLVSNFTTVEITDLVVDNPAFFELVDKQVAEGDLERWKNYLTAKLLNGASSVLSDRFEEANFEFYGKTIRGQKEMEDRWKRILGYLNNRFVIGELVGKLYVEKFFPPTSKEKMMDLVANLIEALEERIKNLDWMGEETKKKALTKLAAFNVKIGYPDKWEDYTDLEINPDMSFIDILGKTVRFVRNKTFERLYKAPDKDKWFMSPQTVNAYYSPLHNEIVFPAAILQFPFFDPEMSDAENYGAIGAVIGHEITHGYDDRGSMFDADGNMNNWWTEEDRKNFMERAEYFVEEYERFKVNGKPLVGKLTLGENIADLGGIRIAFHAMKNHFKKVGEPESDQFSNEEKFFLSYARVWRGLRRPEVEEMLRLSDPHSPPEARVNVALANVPEFHEVYKTKQGDGMYREKLVMLW